MPRNKEPINLIALKGRSHKTKDEIENRKSSELHPKTDKIDPPSYLTSLQKKKFCEIAEQLKDIEIMSNLDCEALARYVVSETEYQKIVRKLRATKLQNDVAAYSALLNIQEKLFKMCRSAAGDLGLTITSRCRIVVPKSKEPPPENRFNRFTDETG